MNNVAAYYCYFGICAAAVPAVALAQPIEAVNFHHPAWSPDGNSIAFDSNIDGDREIFVLKLSDKSVVQLTDNSAEDSHPYWSRDGNRLVFESTRNGDYDIFIMNVDGSGQQRMTTNPAADLLGTWSPDGRHLAFQSDRDGADYNVYTIEIATKDITRLTVSKFFDGVPVWSPTRNEIAFQSNRNGRSEIFIADLDGEVRPVAPHTEVSQSLAWWRRNGEALLFRSSSGEYSSVTRDGDDLRVIISDVAANGVPSLSPNEKKLSLFTDPAPEGADIVLLDIESGKSAIITKALRSDLAPSR